MAHRTRKKQALFSPMPVVPVTCRVTRLGGYLNGRRLNPSNVFATFRSIVGDRSPTARRAPFATTSVSQTPGHAGVRRSKGYFGSNTLLLPRMLANTLANFITTVRSCGIRLLN